MIRETRLNQQIKTTETSRFKLQTASFCNAKWRSLQHKTTEITACFDLYRFTHDRHHHNEDYFFSYRAP